MSYQELAKFNNIAPPYMLHPQQILKIPEKKAGKAQAKSTPTPPTIASQQASAQVNTKAPVTSAAAAPVATAAAPVVKEKSSSESKPLETHQQASTKAPEMAAAPQTVAATPVVKEKRSSETKHPEARVIQPPHR